MASEKADAAESFFTKASNYVSGSIDELKKVSSPSKQETIQATIATIFIIFFVSICLFLLDVFFHTLMQAIL